MNTRFTFRKAHIAALLFILATGFSFGALAKTKSKRVTVSTEAGCVIFVDGVRAEANPADVRIEADATVIVRVERPGFVAQEKTYHNDGVEEIPREDFIKLEKDQAYESSDQSGSVNRDVSLRTNLKEDEAWKLMSQIVTSAFDVLEATDKSAGYMRTSWVLTSFNSCVVRTRLIIKTQSTAPLEYSVKLVSETAKIGTPVTQDDSFKPWDRTLHAYSSIISDLQTRLIR